MQVENNISSSGERKTLKEFIPLVFAFFAGLVALSIYQNIYLYINGVLDGFLNKSLLLLLLHHTGYTALIALLLAFLFNYLEGRKNGMGLRITKILLLVLLGIEGLLMAYYVQNYEILGVGILGISDADHVRFFMLPIVLMLLVTALIFHYVQKAMAKFYQVISRMYPFTIVLFSLFLATLNSDKKPINENKTQHLVSSITAHLLDFNTYEGPEEFPLLKPYRQNDVLGTHFNLSEKKPNIVIIVIDGLGSDFIGTKARFKGFTPFLDNLTKQSLYWEHFVGNAGANFVAFPTIIGSLPFGENGFTNIDQFTNRHTLFSILKKNGYSTSFNYGGNSALNQVDKFLDEERVDIIIDKNSFDDAYHLQEEDPAGISLGYPDGELFKKWNSQSYFPQNPRLDVFLTLSTKNPYLVPNKEDLENQVEKILFKSTVKKRSKKLISKNKEIFASLLYTDKQLEQFISNYKNREDFKNTIFLVTGSHNNTDLPQTNELGRYRVPLLMYSPLLKSPKTISELASHADIVPSLISLLDKRYHLKIPEQVAWLGSGLLKSEISTAQKHIPLFRDRNNIQDYIKGNLFLAGRTVFELDDALNMTRLEDETKEEEIKKDLRYFKSVNSYVTADDKILPESESLLVTRKTDFSKAEMVWVESVFNGKDIDNAYNTARQLAFDKDWNRALLLCKFILSKTPRHADTEILMGRMYSWQKKFRISEETLKEVIRKYPKYADGYSALLDTYFWAGTNEKALVLIQTVQRNEIESDEVNEKVKRAKLELAKKKMAKTEVKKTIANI